MRLIDRVLRRSDFWEGMASGAAILTTTYSSPDREPVLPQLTGAGIQQYGTNGIVFACIMTRMQLFSEVTLKKQSVSDRRLFGDQSLNILEHPWPGGTTGDLLARMEQDVSLAGNAFLWNTDGQLVRRRPDWCTIVSEFRTDPHGRQYRVPIGLWYEPPKTALPDYGDPELYDWDEIVHWAPIPDPNASFRGMSWLTPIIRDAMADTAMTTYKLKYLDNAASPNLLIKYSQKLQPGTIDALRERMAARYGGVDNAYRTLVLDQGADITVVGNSLQQMDFSNVQQAGADRILADASVPGVLVGLEPLRGAGKGYEESLVKFANLWARPQWRSACSALEKVVDGLPPSGVRLWYDTSGVAALQDTETNQAQSALVRAQAVLTLRQAGATLDSAVSAVTSGDLGQIQLDPNAPPPGTRQPGQTDQVQHMLPQAPGSGPGVEPLPAGGTPRLALPAAGISPGSKGRTTMGGRRVAAARRP